VTLRRPQSQRQSAWHVHSEPFQEKQEREEHRIRKVGWCWINSENLSFRSQPVFFLPESQREMMQQQPKQAWTAELSRFAVQLEARATTEHARHEEEARSARATYNRLSVLGLVCGPVGIFVNGLVTVWPKHSTTFTVVGSVFALVATIVIAVQRFGNYSELAESHTRTAGDYLSLAFTIGGELALDIPSRTPANAFVRLMREAFDKIYKASPNQTATTQSSSTTPLLAPLHSDPEPQENKEKKEEEVVVNGRAEKKEEGHDLSHKEQRENTDFMVVTVTPPSPPKAVPARLVTLSGKTSSSVENLLHTTMLEFEMERMKLSSGE